MNVEKFRRTLKLRWLEYYRANRDWLVRLGVWETCQGQRRPASSFVLATLSILEPKLTQMLPLIVDLSADPDRIVLSLGLNFDPDEELKRLQARLQAHRPSLVQPARPIAQKDEACTGVGRDRPPEKIPVASLADPR